MKVEMGYWILSALLYQQVWLSYMTQSIQNESDSSFYFYIIGSTTWIQSTIIAVITTVTFLILTFIITGFICGCLCHRNKLSKTVRKTRHTNEGRQFPSEVSVPHDLEMIENVAYGQLQTHLP